MTPTKRKNKSYTTQFKEETVAHVTEQGYNVTDAASAVGVLPNQIYNWKKRLANEYKTPNEYENSQINVCN